jgi:hypothetical protein
VLGKRLEESPDLGWRTLERVLSKLDKMSREGQEVPIGLAFAAVLLGNLPRKVREEIAGGESGEQVLACWDAGIDDGITPSDSLLAQSAEDERRSVILSNIDFAPEVLPGRRRSREAEDTALKKFINRIFHPLGVSRKDRELMEQVLRARYVMLRHGPEMFGREVFRKSYFEVALLFVKLTVHDASGKQMCRLWERALHSGGQKRNKERRTKPENQDRYNS